MMVKKSDENLRVQPLNETVGENCFLPRTTPRPVYNWNIVESGVEHHNPNYCTFYGSILELFNLYDHHNSKNLDIPKG
jgi:hypothetical protein